LVWVCCMGVGIIDVALVGLMVVGAGLMVGSGAVFLLEAPRLDIVSATNTITWLTYGCLTMLAGGVGLTMKVRLLEPFIATLVPIEIKEKTKVK
jgi:hypothetical protein